MDLSLWRSRSRIVAYIDLVLSSLGLLLTVLLVVLGATATVVIADQKDKNEKLKDIPEKDLHAVLWVVWAGLAIMAFIICVDLWAAIMLLKATKIGADPMHALGRAKIWRNVTIAFLIFSLIYNGFMQSFFSLAIEILFRGILLYVVCKFIAELQQVNGSAPGPDNVVVKQ